MKWLVLSLLLAVGACTSEQGTVTTMDATQFARAIEADNVFVIDTHTPEQEHIEGTDAFIPYNALEDNKNLLPRDKNTPIAVYCRSGSMSKEAAQTLQQMGYKTIYDLEGGATTWRNANLQFRSLENELEGTTATLYKSPSCGCCVGYTGELEQEGANVETIPTLDMSLIKKQHSIPKNMESCHTTEIDGYFVEGHVPFEAVEKLLAEKPDIDGIALPGMPAGSPGMPGTKNGAWTIYSLKDGVTQPYMVI